MALILDGTNGLFGDVTGGDISGNFIIDSVNLQDGSVTESKIAPILATGSTAPRNLRDRFADVVNVKDFGVVGNGSSSDEAGIQTALSYAISNNKIIGFDFNATIRIPTDAPTLQDAIDHIDSLVDNISVTLIVESGHVLTSGFRISNRDCSFIKISSTDSTVNVSPSMTLVNNIDLSSDVPRSSEIGFLAVRSKMPTWNILVDMSNRSCVTGYELDYGSDGVVLPTKGVINTARTGESTGVNCRVTTNSRLQAAQSVWTGAKAGNIAITTNSFANLQNANLSVTDNEACLDVSRGSVVHALGVNVSDGLYAGIYARRAFVSAQGANLTNCGRGAWASLGSFLGIPEALFDGCATDVVCENGSFISLGRALKDGNNLSPANSVVQGATSGTIAPRAFNIAGGYGCISYVNNLPGNAEYLSGGSGLQTITSASNQNIASMTYATALNLTGKRLVHGGAIYGADAGVKITIDGNVILNDGNRVLGQDSSGNNFSSISIPPCKCESSILIECYNRSSVAENFGWRFYHTNSL